jgi:type I restriction enzyme M protein
MSDIVNKLWGFCHTLRHDGVDYGDYIEQLTYLLFLKMADEKEINLSTISYQNEKGKTVTLDCSWKELNSKSGSDLFDHFTDVLRVLAKQPGILGDIFQQAMPRFNNPVNLKRVISMIDEEEWSSMDVDVKGAAFEGLLEKAASEGKKGAGQYFTPRVLIDAIVRVMQPDPRGKSEFKICDPACGTGGFLVRSYEWLVSPKVSKGVFDRKDIKRIKTQTYYGQDLVPRPRRLALMNLFLHGVEPQIHLGDTIYDPDRGERYDVILTNPPFGTKGANQAPNRDDFTIETSNKQLNFVQHVVNVLKPGGRAAMVLPDNCLFEGKAGEVFEILMHDCNLHTILRLPRGTFTPYSQGVKANVIFFQKGRSTEKVWIFDARSNVEGITKKDRPLAEKHFEEFEKCYGKDPNGLSRRTDLGETGRFRSFSIDEIKERGYKLDITWLKDESLEDSDELPEPQDLASEAITELEAVVDDLKDLVELLEKEEGVEK